MAIAPETALEELCNSVRAGKAWDADGATIEADDIVRLVLSLPLRPGEKPCPTPAGIQLNRARIKGRIELDNATLSSDGAVCAIVLRECWFHGGFSGAHGHFSRLCFRDSVFIDGGAKGQDKRPLPTINLIGARLERSLALRGIRPHAETDYLWIRAPGARIAGVLDLSCAHLRAPFEQGCRKLCDLPVAALDLAGADIGGDAYFFNGVRCEGSIYARAVHVRGNLWLSGATLEPRGGDSTLLFLQRARIDGTLSADRRPDHSSKTGPCRDFICAGDISLRAATIQGDLFLKRSAIGGKTNLLDITIGKDFTFDASVRDEIDLTGCRVGASLVLSRLRTGVTPGGIKLKDGVIGRSLRRKVAPPNLKLLAARREILRCLPGAEFVEALWADRKGKETELVQTGFLITEDDVFVLDGFASGFNEVLKKIPYAIDDKPCAEEFLRLYGTYARGEAAFPIVGSRAELDAFPFVKPEPGPDGKPTPIDDGLFPIDISVVADGFTMKAGTLHNGSLVRCRLHLNKEKGLKVVNFGQIRDGPPLLGQPCFEGHALYHPALDDIGRKKAVAGRTWVTAPTLAGLADVPADELAALSARLRPAVLARYELAGSIDLGNLRCETLDDGGGRLWGPAAQIEMNHFVYQQSGWDRRPESSTSRRLSNMVLRWIDDWLWPSCLRLPAWLRKRVRFREPWQTRLRWIYQQFDPKRRPANILRYDIRDREYRPQPLEQAIHAARAEGREDFAVHFEMRKYLVEWRHFNRMMRWPLAFLGLGMAAFWLLAHGGSWTLTGLTGLLTAIMMIFASRIDAVVHKWFECPPVRRALSEIAFYFPTLLILLPFEWADHPFHYIVALLIYIAIRSLSNFSHLLMRFGFGYLRRPARAICTLMLAFLIGWYGVGLAKDRGMLVIAAEPVATIAAPEGNRLALNEAWVMGSGSAEGTPALVRDISCDHELSEPLYALDILIPLIDLQEESRCEIRRLEAPPPAQPESNSATSAQGPAAQGHRIQGQPERRPLAEMSIGELWQALPNQAFDDHRFWWWMKALYAIFGWIIVSLSILTFAQVNKVHAEPPEEHK
jgi:hypothetical protein